MESTILENISEDDTNEFFIDEAVSIVNTFRDKIAEDFQQHFQEDKNLFVSKWATILGITTSSFIVAMADLSPDKEHTRNTILNFFNSVLDEHLSKPYDGFLGLEPSI